MSCLSSRRSFSLSARPAPLSPGAAMATAMAMWETATATEIRETTTATAMSATITAMETREAGTATDIEATETGTAHRMPNRIHPARRYPVARRTKAMDGAGRRYRSGDNSEKRPARNCCFRRSGAIADEAITPVCETPPPRCFVAISRGSRRPCGSSVYLI